MTLTPDDLVGYVADGLDADLARWFADRPPVTVPAGTRPVAPMLDRLPPPAATALAAFDQRVRSGRMPQFLDIYDWSYGFDFAGNDCGILDADYETVLTDDDVYSIGADGGGNLHVMLANGQVGLWFHEEEVVEGGTRFDSLDVSSGRSCATTRCARGCSTARRSRPTSCRWVRTARWSRSSGCSAP
ncbi:hypothetical protein ACIA59_29260 [Micromonospora haikouensis]|uniref:hypothetical protein n=1 Tax=Micromonospora haikouensis TaxID=686309 RepID=UPI003793DBD1